MKKLLGVLILIFIVLSILLCEFQALANWNCELGIAAVSPFGYQCK